MNSLSLRIRLNLILVITMLVINGVGALFIVNNARRSVAEEVQASVAMALQLVNVGFVQANKDETELMHWLTALAGLGKAGHLRIRFHTQPETLIDLDAQQASVTTAPDAPDWFVWAVSPARVVDEQILEMQNGSRLTLLVEANPADEISEAWHEAQGFLWLVMALALAVCLLVHIMLGLAFKSVAVILRGLEEIEQGDYSQRLPQFDLPEFERISAAFNRAAQALTRARQENQVLARQALAIQEDERRVMARELHDEMGQSLTAIKAMAGVLRLNKISCEEYGKEAVETIIVQCDQLFKVLRSVMRRLRPALLDELGLSAVLEDMLLTWQARNVGVQVKADIAADLDKRCHPDLKIQLFRLVQECLTNVEKHAEASKLEIDIRLEGQGGQTILMLRIFDNGKGFDKSRVTNGFGLMGMRERVLIMGGSLVLQSELGVATEVLVRVPCVPGNACVTA